MFLSISTFAKVMENRKFSSVIVLLPFLSIKFFGERKSLLWFLFHSLGDISTQQSSVNLHKRDDTARIVCASSGSISDCWLYLFMSKAITFKQSSLWKWSAFRTLFSMRRKHYAFVEYYGSNGMIWFHIVSEQTPMKKILVLIKLWNVNNAFSIELMFLSF